MSCELLASQDIADLLLVSEDDGGEILQSEDSTDCSLAANNFDLDENNMSLVSIGIGIILL